MPGLLKKQLSVENTIIKLSIFVKILRLDCQ